MSHSFPLFLSCMCSHCHASLIFPFLSLLFFLHHQLLCIFLPFIFFLLHILQAESEPISIYHPTAKEVFTAMGTPMEGFFNRANLVVEGMAPTASATA